MQQLFGVALQKRNTFPHERGIFLRRNPARTRRKTPPEMLIKAGTLLADVAREYPAVGLSRFSVSEMVSITRYASWRLKYGPK